MKKTAKIKKQKNKTGQLTKSIFFLLIASVLLTIVFLLIKKFLPGGGDIFKIETPEYGEQNMQGIVTNQWYSSLFFNEWSEPMFAFPLVYKIERDGLYLSYPQIVGSEKTIFGSFVPDLKINTTDKFSEKKILGADPASVKFSLCSEKKCFNTRLIHGSPVIYLEAETDLSLEINGTNAVTTNIENGMKMKLAKASYLIGVKDENNHFLTNVLVKNGSNLKIDLKTSQNLILALKPDDNEISLADCNQITGTNFGYKEKSGELNADLVYEHDEENKPLIALLPHQWEKVKEPAMGSYHSIRGEMKLYQTDWIAQRFSEPEILDFATMIGKLTEEEKVELGNRVEADTKKISEDTGDDVDVIYEAGKRIFKLAQLYEIAQALDHPQKKVLAGMLQGRLIKWLSLPINEPNSLFVYSESPQGIIAKNPQFFNELFNDHHFHYGYFLASAGIYLKYNPDFYAQIQPGIDLLLKDIANTDVSNGYSFLRGFDVYESHSWADGRALTADGNNQESTSEAINRWYGIYRLAEAIENKELATLGLVGLEMEQQAARIYWLGQKPDLYQFPSEYKHPMVSLLWGGKVDYATWFSGLDNHILGIQFLPITPAMTHIADKITFDKYKDYKALSVDNSWDDIYYMLAVTNGKDVPDSVDIYEGGNTSSFYYLWVKYWGKI